MRYALVFALLGVFYLGVLSVHLFLTRKVALQERRIRLERLALAAGLPIRKGESEADYEGRFRRYIRLRMRDEDWRGVDWRWYLDRPCITSRSR